ncbi:MAG: hypothetical protein NVSMB14_14320 [Isosphaeraceae bacterium]
MYNLCVTPVRSASPGDDIATQLHFGPPTPLVHKLRDDAGRLWEGTDVEALRERVIRENLWMRRARK